MMSVRALCFPFILCFVQHAFAQGGTKPQTPSYSAEQCTIAFYEQDSVAMRMSGFKPLNDSMNAMKKRLSELQNQSFLATDRMLMAAPGDSGATMPAAQQKTFDDAKKESTALDGKIVSLKSQMDAFTTQHLVPYYEKVRKAADTVAKRQHITQVYEINATQQISCPTDQRLMVDITRDVAELLGLKMYSFRIGIFNRDSLLRLIPGYAVRADSTLAELRALDAEVAVMDKNIAAKQHELDSLRPTLKAKEIRKREEEITALQEARDEKYAWDSYNIQKRGEERCVTYSAKLDAVLPVVAKENTCRYYYSSNANIPWTDKEAEFVNINAALAKKLITTK